MSFKIEEESVYLKYAEILNKIKSVLNVKFHSQPIYDGKYIKTKVKTFNKIHSSQEMKFLKKEITLCIPTICTDSILKAAKKNYPQLYLEQCKYQIKKRELVNFIDDEVDLSSKDSDGLKE